MRTASLLALLLLTGAGGLAQAQTSPPAQPLLERLRLKLPGAASASAATPVTPAAGPARARLDDLRLNVPGPAPTPAQKATGTAGSAVAGSVAGPVDDSLADCLGTVVEFGQR